MKISYECSAFEDKGGIVKTIVKVVEAHYNEVVDLVLVYGSYVTGIANPLSDIDFCFVPKTEEAYGLMHSFIMEGIGYDLWPMDWERLEGISDFKESMISILLNSQVVFARNQACLERYQALQAHARMQMAKVDNGHLLWRIGFLFNDMKSKLFDLKESKTIGGKRGYALSFLEDCLTVIAYLNQTYVRKGPERICLEKENFTYLPEAYLGILNQVCHAPWHDAFYDDLVEVFQILQKKYRDETTITSSDRNDNLVGFYEETKSAYNKIVHAVANNDHLKLAYAAMQIDRETLDFFGADHGFPRLLDFIEDPSGCQETAYRHELTLLDYLHKNNIDICFIKHLDDLEDLLVGKQQNMRLK